MSKWYTIVSQAGRTRGQWNHLDRAKQDADDCARIFGVPYTVEEWIWSPEREVIDISSPDYRRVIYTTTEGPK